MKTIEKIYILVVPFVGGTEAYESGGSRHKLSNEYSVAPAGLDLAPPSPAVGSLGPVALTGLQEPSVTQPDELLEANLRPRWCLPPVRRLLPGARALGWRRVPHGPEPALARLQGPLAAAEVALLRGRAVIRGVADLHALALRGFHLEQAGLSGFGRPAYVFRTSILTFG